MLYLLKFVFNPLLWIILNFVVSDINTYIEENFNELSKVDCYISVKDSYYFIMNSSDTLTEINNLDSANLTSTISPFFSNESEYFLKKIIYSGNIPSFLQLSYGVFQFNPEFKDFKISISSKLNIEDLNFYVFKNNKYIGFDQQTPYFDEINSEKKEILNFVGLNNYFILTTFFHEISHYLNFLNLNKIFNKDYNKIKENLNNEEKTDLMADTLMIKYFNKLR